MNADNSGSDEKASRKGIVLIRVIRVNPAADSFFSQPLLHGHADGGAAKGGR
jgi:hypothetical protein